MQNNQVPRPDFRSTEWLKKHIFDTIRFYYPTCLDNNLGAFYHDFRDDGKVLDEKTKHLVGTARFTFIFSIGAILGGPEWCLSSAERGLKALQEQHLDPAYGGYYWLLEKKNANDSQKHAYGHAFALLAASIAYRSGITWAKEVILDIYELLELRFWEPKYGLYLDEASRDWITVSSYRGQNANMHMCEAMLAAYEATQESKYLDRAYELAKSVVQNLASQSDGLIWEHYDKEWKIDWQYNINDPKNLFRPYGYLPGHFVEWSKLLLILERYKPEDWMLSRAQDLFDISIEKALDSRNGGIFYSFSPEGKILDSDKYHWVMSEAIGASALLAVRTGKKQYWQWYEKFWEYAWNHHVDHANGGWYRILTPTNQKYSDVKSPPSKTDYHPIGACYECIRALKREW